jgi:hypothetical protein
VIDCVSNRSCVAPNGADQSNHRFDQSVFSIVLAKMHIRCHNNWKFNGYLEEDRLHEVRAAAVAAASLSSLTPQADRWDVDNGFGRSFCCQSTIRSSGNSANISSGKSRSFFRVVAAPARCCEQTAGDGHCRSRFAQAFVPQFKD